MLNKLPILAFHSIDSTGSTISICPTLFRGVLENLQAKGHHAVLLSDVVEWIQGKKQLPERSVALTFDDGFHSVYEQAFPLLEDFGFSATLFLTTKYCGKHNDWPSQVHGIPKFPMLNWPQLTEMSRQVFEVQAHTKTHPYLSRTNTESMLGELVDSKNEIQDRLGKAVKFFAYPYGDYNSKVLEVTRQCFDGACSTELGFVTSNSNKHLLERIDMYYFSTNLSTKLFDSFLQQPYVYFRGLLRKLKS